MTARERGAFGCIVHNTLATPYLCRPFEWGADIIVHSLTKFVDEPRQLDRTARWSNRASSIGDETASSRPSPSDTSDYHNLRFYETFGRHGLLRRGAHRHAERLRPRPELDERLPRANNGIETMPLRMQRHCVNAQGLAEYHAGHDKIGTGSSAYDGCTRANTFISLPNTCPVVPAR